MRGSGNVVGEPEIDRKQRSVVKHIELLLEFKAVLIQVGLGVQDLHMTTSKHPA
jgi:hypothetical protein